MHNTIRNLFLGDFDLDEELEAFCERNPEYRKTQQEFYAVAHEIAEMIGFEQYDRLERSFGSYLNCANDIHYLFGLGLRQELLSALGADEPTSGEKRSFS